MTINGVGQIGVRVHDVDKAVLFYRDVLGMRLVFQTVGMAFFDVGGVRLMIGNPTSEEFDHPSSVIYYTVDDIHIMHKQLIDKGVTFEQNPHSVGQIGIQDIWMAFFRDVDNNVLAIMSEIEVNKD